MANELTVTASLEFNATGINIPALENVDFNVSGTEFIHQRQPIGTSEEAINLGSLSGQTLGWAIFKNLDSTNYIEIRSATGDGNDIIKLPPGGVALFHFGSDVTAPYAIANTSECLLEYRIHEA